jgi:tetratricopeptide (TPR) repeat protein
MPLARDEFLRATTLDPDYARAHAWLGRAYSLLARRALGDVETNQARASVAFDRALRLDPALGEIWWVRSQGVDGDDSAFSARARSFEQALAASPGDTDLMMWLGGTYFREGRRAEGLRMFERALTGGLLARMAAANGDRDALVRHLKELVDSGSMAFAFARHEPMIQSYLGLRSRRVARPARGSPRGMGEGPPQVFDARADSPRAA